MQLASHERQIAMPWLARLRWIAVVGQIGATALGVIWLRLQLPLPWIALVISITALSNLAMQIWDRFEQIPPWIAPAVLLLDVCMFTVLLFLTGGTDNPFSVLYAVHVAMAIVMLGSRWAWIIAIVSALSYGAMFFWHLPLTPDPSLTIFNLGQWCSLVLVMVLSAYFIGRVNRSLRDAEKQLADARERTSRHEHLAALTTLAAGAAHELGTPLGTIALVAKEMERELDPVSPMAEDARLIRTEVDRCREILDRMRVDVIEDAGQRPSFQTWAELVEDLKEDLRANERQRLEIVTQEGGDEVVGRSRVLRRAIGVLLRNGFEASPPDGKVQLFFERREGRMIFAVQDSGSGMSAEVLRRAGQPFFTTKQPGAGMGLGLFLVRLVAETYRGRFKLESAPGAGTRSVLELPDRPASEGDADDVEAEVENAGGG